MSAHTLFEFQHPLRKFLLTCSPSPPPAPDYTAAAAAQGAANVDAARAQSKLNNPNVIGPYGTQTVTYGGGFNQQGYNDAKAAWDRAELEHRARYGIAIPTSAYKPGYQPPNERDFYYGDPDQATVTQTLNPAQQAILDKSNQTQLGLSDLALQGTNLAKGVLGQSLDFSQLPDRPGSAEDTRTKVMDAMMSRVNEDTDRKENQLNSSLLASGIPKGSQAYNDAMALTERARTDARNQALLASGQEMTRDFQTDTQRRRDALAEMLTQRETPLNEINALQSGSQINNPFSTPGVAQNSQVSAAPVFGSTQAQGDWNADQYNAQAAQAGNTQAGLIGLGGTALMGGMMLF